MKTIILGVGNQILGDDGVGVHVTNTLKKQIKNPDITIDEAVTGGLNLLDLIIGYDKAIIIDAIKNNNEGNVKKIPINEISTIHSSNPHDVSFFEAINMAKKLGENKIPKDIILIGISIKEIPSEFSDKLSKKIEKSIPKAVKMVIDELKNN